MKALLAIFVAVMLAACSGLPVSTDYAPGYDFSGLNSYAWLPPKEDNKLKPDDPEANNDLVRQRIQGAVDSQLAARGFKKVADPQKASMLVTYHNGLEDKIAVDNVGAWNNHFGYYPCYHCFRRPGFGYYGDPYFFHQNQTWVRNYTENRLIIDIIDPESRSLIWRGIAKRSQPRLSTPEERRLYVLETVSAILAEFPPGYSATQP
ncbi:protein of unknown function (DUF4136) [Spongiibacter sp. IMCC21906]|uniref:DUF4136 domain-containing protein n=1 Tax=Spongiibacter sp. IMCC21906 TaxID=1620392 RepID=UPI00062DFAAD|nr:DUF4136 domain-containing protein [Spongiibacter sp. IMCC21906]AKH69756.1 protein of unknown function (DUF4136) [Spongiibacter sp. IMCC21906]